MSSITVSALFESRGIAEDAMHRLHSEGVHLDAVDLHMLREIRPVPQTMAPELDALNADPLVLGDVHRSFARFLSNGETVLMARTDDLADADLAETVIRRYSPIEVKRYA